MNILFEKSNHLVFLMFLNIYNKFNEKAIFLLYTGLFKKILDNRRGYLNCAISSLISVSIIFHLSIYLFIYLFISFHFITTFHTELAKSQIKPQNKKSNEKKELL